MIPCMFTVIVFDLYFFSHDQPLNASMQKSMYAFPDGTYTVHSVQIHLTVYEKQFITNKKHFLRGCNICAFKGLHSNGKLM